MHDDTCRIWRHALTVATMNWASETPYGTSFHVILALPGEGVMAVGAALEWRCRPPIQQPFRLTHTDGGSKNRTGSNADFSVAR